MTKEDFKTWKEAHSIDFSQINVEYYNLVFMLYNHISGAHTATLAVETLTDIVVPP